MRYRIFLPCLLFLFMGTPVYAETFTEQLQDLVKTHKRILATKAVVDSLGEGLAVSKKAYWPEVSLTALQGHESRKNAEGTLDTGIAISEADMTITQPMDVWDVKGSAVHISRLQVEQGKLSLEQTVQSIILEAVTATINLRSSSVIEDYARRSVSNIKEQAQLEDARVAKGAGLSTDVLQAKIQLAGAEARLTLAEGTLGQAINRYRAVFGYEPADMEALPDILLPVSRIPISKEECVELALENNFQINSLRKAEEVARTSVKQLKATQYRPDLNLIFDSKRKNNVSGIRGDTNEWIAKVELKYSFNVAGAALNSVNASKLNYIATSNQLQDATNLVEEQAKNTFEQFEITRKNAGFLENQANIAAEFLALAREERRLGTRSLIDVLSGETAEINALSDAAAANSQIEIAAYTLLFIMGDLGIEAVETSEAASLPTGSEYSEQETEPEEQPDFTQIEVVKSHPNDASKAPTTGEQSATALELSAEPVVQSQLVRVETLTRVEEELVALKTAPEAAAKIAKLSTDIYDSDNPRLPEPPINVAAKVAASQEPEPVARVPVDREPIKTESANIETTYVSPVVDPVTLPSIDSETTELLARVIVGMSDEFVSDDPNFQRQWSY